MPPVTREQVEDFLYAEAALLDAWKLDEWLALLTEDAVYRVPSNDKPASDPKDTLFTIADDIHRSAIREQVEMGVAVRMAVLAVLAKNNAAHNSARGPA